MSQNSRQIFAEIARIPGPVEMNLTPSEMLDLFDIYPINAIGYSPVIGPMTVRREESEAVRAENLRGDETHAEISYEGSIWIVPFGNLPHFFG